MADVTINDDNTMTHPPEDTSLIIRCLFVATTQPYNCHVGRLRTTSEELRLKRGYSFITPAPEEPTWGTLEVRSTRRSFANVADAQ